MSSLIITLPRSLPTAASVCSTVWTEDNQTIKRQLDAPLSLLPDTPGAEVVVVVPIGQLSWHRLEFPKGTLERGFFQEGNTARLRSVLEGLLEERILDEPSQLHFAVEPEARAGAPAWVTACDRAWLNAWLTTLEQAGRPVARIVPELQPASPNGIGAAPLQVMGSLDHADLVFNGPDGLTALPFSHSSLALVAQALSGDTVHPVLAEPAVAELAEQHFKGRVSLQTSAQRALAAAQSTWDLAQFDLLRTRGTRTRKRLATLSTTLLRSPQWRPARWAAFALVVVNLAGLQVWAWKEQSALTAKRLALRTILTTTFPDVRVVVDPPLQMARSLADLQRQSGAASSADLETMLGLFQTVAPEVPAPSAIEFAAGELRLKLLDLTVASAVNARLQTHGYTVVVVDDRLIMKQERKP